MIATRSSSGGMSSSSSPAPCAMKSIICSSKYVAGVALEKSGDLGPPQPTMLPATSMRGPIRRPCAIESRIGDERNERTIAVAHGGDAVLELRLRRFDDEIEEPVLVPHHRFAVVVQRQVHVGIDEAGRGELAGGVDDAGASRNRRPTPAGRRRRCACRGRRSSRREWRRRRCRRSRSRRRSRRGCRRRSAGSRPTARRAAWRAVRWRPARERCGAAAGCVGESSWA